MDKIYEKLGFTIGFLILVLLVQQMISEKASSYFVGATLLSVLVLNTDELVGYIEKIKGGL